MIRKIYMLMIALFGCLQGCNQQQKNASDSIAADSTEISIERKSDPQDSIPDYDKNVSDAGTAARIGAVLPKILSRELVGADSTARRFVYYETDLNDDGRGEFFVGFTGMNWCGSGGCTALLLSHQFELITYFTVADFPFIVLDNKTSGWKDLVVYSGGSDRLLQWKGKSYPANPSVAPKFKGKLDGGAARALAPSERPYPWFTF